jgi:hypothetical protein
MILCVQYECVKNLSKISHKIRKNSTDSESEINEKPENSEVPSETILREKENFIENNKKALVLIKSRPEVPFITDSEDVSNQFKRIN